MNLVSGRCWIKAERGCRGQGCLMVAARWGVNALSIEVFFFLWVCCFPLKPGVLQNWDFYLFFVLQAGFHDEGDYGGLLVFWV